MKRQPKTPTEQEQVQQALADIRRLNEKLAANAAAKPGDQTVVPGTPPEQVAHDEKLGDKPSARILAYDDAPLRLRQYDVVQVYDRESNHYGVIFQVGDVRGTQVHGYYFQPRGEKVYVTFKMDQLRLIGTARVRSKSCCSPKWVSDHNS